MSPRLISILPIPIVLGLPAVFSPIPPLMVRIPATLSFGVQVSAPSIGVAAVLASVVDRFVQPHLGFFNCALALLAFTSLR